jgi:hypothetical protein
VIFLDNMARSPCGRRAEQSRGVLQSQQDHSSGGTAHSDTVMECKLVVLTITQTQTSVSSTAAVSHTRGGHSHGGVGGCDVLDRVCHMTAGELCWMEVEVVTSGIRSNLPIIQVTHTNKVLSQSDSWVLGDMCWCCGCAPRFQENLCARCVSAGMMVPRREWRGERGERLCGALTVCTFVGSPFHT